MANKTSFKSGTSGNPNGRPPKCRALTDILAKVGKMKRAGVDGQMIAGNELIAHIIWNALVSGQLIFPKGNRIPDGIRMLREHERIIELGGRDWIELMRWLYAQVDGDLSVSYDESKGGEEDGGATGADDNAPILYIPTNGRDFPGFDPEALVTEGEPQTPEEALQTETPSTNPED